MFKEVLVAVVTHNGSQTISDLLNSLAKAAGSVSSYIMVLDNNSSDDTLEKLQTKKFINFDLDIRALKKNIGLGGAYNLALQEAEKNNFKWLFLLDQDSVCAENCLEVLVRTGNKLLNENIALGAVFATPRSLTYPETVHFPYALKQWKLVPESNMEDELVQVASGISSGTLYNVEALESAGGFRESYFIDFIDHECHVRMSRSGWDMFWSTRATIYHRLGSAQKMYPDGLWIEHEPFRYYYMSRNMSHGYFKLGGLKALFFFWSQAWHHMQLVWKRNSQPGRCIKYFIKGLIHAAQGKSGPLNPGN